LAEYRLSSQGAIKRKFCDPFKKIFKGLYYLRRCIDSKIFGSLPNETRSAAKHDSCIIPEPASRK